MIEQSALYKTLAIHSQSTRDGSPYGFNTPEEQAFDSRALALPNVGIIGLTTPLEPAYAKYRKDVLKIDTPHVVVPKGNGSSLSEKLLTDPQAIQRIKKSQEELDAQFTLSVFDPTNTERQLLDRFVTEGIQVFPEANFDISDELGNKTGFRRFCDRNGIPQLPGGVFTTEEDLKKFLREHSSVIVKHSISTAGEGQSIITKNNPVTMEHFRIFRNWMEQDGVVAELFMPSASEYSLHIYIDPVTHKGKVSGIYKQLVKKTETDTLTHYGVIYPLEDLTTEKELSRLGEETLIPALQKENYTGPACLDVLAGPDFVHFMDFNARTGANMYLHRQAEQVGLVQYGTDAVALSSLVGLPHEITSFEKFSKRFGHILAPTENGMLVLTNPGRHAFGKYDVSAISPHGLAVAQNILATGISEIWGAQKAKAFFARIYQRE
ncbi:MAG TPA: hypothetical protein VE090_01745 [Methylomirabilota bacterium]|nr:hypothetical protein [Methylomirabilota bacterium]